MKLIIKLIIKLILEWPKWSHSLLIKYLLKFYRLLIQNGMSYAIIYLLRSHMFFVPFECVSPGILSFIIHYVSILMFIIHYALIYFNLRLSNNFSNWSNNFYVFQITYPRVILFCLRVILRIIHGLKKNWIINAKPLYRYLQTIQFDSYKLKLVFTVKN